MADFLRCCCPQTKAEIKTNITIDAPTLARVWGTQIRLECQHCGGIHVLAVREAYVEQALACLPVRSENLISSGPRRPPAAKEGGGEIRTQPGALEAHKAAARLNGVEHAAAMQDLPSPGGLIGERDEAAGDIPATWPHAPLHFPLRTFVWKERRGGIDCSRDESPAR